MEEVGCESNAQSLGPWNLWEAEGQRWPTGRWVPELLSTVLFLHHITCLPLDRQGCKPLFQGHWPLHTWTKVRESSFWPLFSFFYFFFFNLSCLCSAHEVGQSPGPFLYFPFWVTSCQAPSFEVNPMAFGRRTAEWTLLGEVTLVGIHRREKVKI